MSNDAGAGVKLREKKDRAAEVDVENSEDVSRNMHRATEAGEAYRKLKEHLKDKPELKDALRRVRNIEKGYMDSQIDDALEDKEYSRIEKYRGRDISESTERKIKSMEDLKKAKKLVDQQDE